MTGVVILLNDDEAQVIAQTANRVSRMKSGWRSMTWYVSNVLTGCSHLMNALIGGNPSQTIGCRAFRNQNTESWLLTKRYLDSVLSPKSKNHCLSMMNQDLENAKRILSCRK